MAMSGKLQSQLAPVTPPNSFEFNKLAVADKGKVQDKDSDPQVEFRTLLQNSNADTMRERSAKKSGDLSSAKTDEEFRSMLAEKANPARAPKNTLGKDDFMKLFIAQMQSQDPLNPQDSSQMAAQMAQFNGLEQMMNVNKTLETMLKSQTTDRTVGMVNYVGKEVDIGTGMLKWDKNKLTKSTFEVNQPLANAFIEVRDSSGQIISQNDLGNLMPGEHNLKWDGKLKDNTTANPGIYHFSLVGKSVEGQEEQIPIKSKVKITGVDLQTEGGAFFTELGKIAVKDVTSVGLQGFEDARMATSNVQAPAVAQQVQPALSNNESLNQSAEEFEQIISADGRITGKGLSPQNPEALLPISDEQLLMQNSPAPTDEPAQEGSVTPNPNNLNIPVTIAKR